VLVIAADGGALVADSLGLHPDIIIGDGDSLPAADAERLHAAGAELISHPAAKDASDTELAARLAVERGATRLWILGALSGPRFDHALANVLLLCLPDLAALDAALFDGLTMVRLVGEPGSASTEIHGAEGDWVSLLPLSERVDGVTTDGLAYPLTAEALAQGPTRGLSNELTGAIGRVTVSAGRLAVIHTRRDAEQ
jgi:thiamine pyrophosphokinase